MKGFLGVSVLIFVGMAGWQVSLSIDPDVALIVIGFLFGAAASLPAALLMLVANRRNERRQDESGPQRGRQESYPQIMVLPPQQPNYPAQQQPAHNPYMVTGGGAFDNMPTPQQDGRFRLNGGGR